MERLKNQEKELMNGSPKAFIERENSARNNDVDSGEFTKMKHMAMKNASKMYSKFGNDEAFLSGKLRQSLVLEYDSGNDKFQHIQTP